MTQRGNRREAIFFEDGTTTFIAKLPINDAIKAIESGAIEDGKTIMLLQYAGMHLFNQGDTHV